MTADEIKRVREIFDEIEKVAFSIPPVNQYTPWIVQLCNAGRAALTKGEPTSAFKVMADHFGLPTVTNGNP